jgi:hypothetical protein
MKQDEIIQTAIIYIAQKGANTDELLIRRQEILVKGGFIAKNTNLSSRNYLISHVDRMEFTVNENSNYFEVYPSVMGQYEWVGSADGICRFRENRTLSEYSSTIKSQVPSITRYYLEEAKLRVTDNIVETIRVQFVPVSPSEVLTFNPDYDEYPIDDALIPQVMEMMYEMYFKKIDGRPIDTKSDSQDTPKVIP